MYLINYDLYDLEALIVFFRSKPERLADYKSALNDIIDYIKKPQGHYGDHNNIRKIFRPYFCEIDEIISWVLVDNVYPANIYIIKHQVVYTIISAILCDAIYNIPSILIDEVKKKKIIKIMIKEYKKKYNPKFLNDELKLL